MEGFPGGPVCKESTCNAGDTGDVDSILGLPRFPWRRMATHSSILAWRISWTEESGRLKEWGRKESVTTEQLN